MAWMDPEPEPRPPFSDPGVPEDWNIPWMLGGGGGAGAASSGGGGGGKKKKKKKGKPPWRGAIGWEPMPWEGWGKTPWASLPNKRAKEAQAWLNVALPWQQAYSQAQQWGQEFDWRKQMDLWTQQFQQQQLEQMAQEAALQAYGRRWRPQTRWM